MPSRICQSGLQSIAADDLPDFLTLDHDETCGRAIFSLFKSDHREGFRRFPVIGTVAGNYRVVEESAPAEWERFIAVMFI